MIVLGYRMWFRRRPTASARAGRPFPRGAWRHLPPPLLALIAAIAIAVGWFIPLLGLTLLAFLLVDAAVGVRGRRTA